MSTLQIPVRHYRLGVEPGAACEEDRFQYQVRNWTLPVAQTALVMVDCWDIHYIQSHEERSGQICRERLLPVVEACRRAGIAVVHAPSPPRARHYPQWVRYAGDEELAPRPAPPPDWPPEAFRKREGEWAAFAKPREWVLDEWAKRSDQQRIVPEIAPQPDDFVIATGAQLHRLCRDRGIMHLLYAGFAANMCVLYRDYGTRAMHQRGYNVILLRDCTTAIEAAHTLAEEGLTQWAILEIEMTVGTSTTSEEVVRACAAI
jgi:nicotinamidase-related amidase